MSQSIVVIGASMGGLATALAFKHSGREVLIVERDAAPPEIEPTAAFDDWERPGVPQFRLSHSLLARLQKILRLHHPEVLSELARVGVELCPMRFVLPSTQIDSYAPHAQDIDLRHLLGRRATFEYVLRRYVEQLPHVRFMSGTRVEGLQIESSGQGLCVRGIEIARGGARETLPADFVVDASGGRSRCAEWLTERGATVTVESQPSDFVYFCKHYRAQGTGAEPFAQRTGAILDYLWFGAFFAEHGHFSLALACPTAESELVQTMRDPEGFDAIGRSLPGVDALLARSRPVGKVLGAGKLTNRWSRFGGRGAPELLGFFPVGDAHVQTNPMYGRGCSAAFVQAHALAEVVCSERDPAVRPRRYADRVWALLRPQYDFCISAERLFSGRGQRARGLPVPGSLRIADYLTDQIWAPAVLESPFVARESVKTMQMQEVSGFWVRLGVLLCMFWLWARRGFRTVALVPERTGPGRAELLGKLAQRTRGTERERAGDEAGAGE